MSFHSIDCFHFNPIDQPAADYKATDTESFINCIWVVETTELYVTLYIYIQNSS